MHISIRCTALITVLTLNACSTLPSPDIRIRNITALAEEQGWQPLALQTQGIELRGFEPRETHTGARLHIYIEGDGLAWITRNRPSSNPTPITPTALQLALADPGNSAIYLGRPCQYQSTTDCPAAYWLEQRFASEVIDAYSAALDELKIRYDSSSFRLIGYSGGGAIAALLAARRDDIDQLITVAGNLDTAYWVQHHRISPLSGSLNPADEIPRLQHVPQWHLLGAEDRVIPPAMLRQFIGRFPRNAIPALQVLPGYDHHCCWTDNWPVLLRQVTSQIER